MRRCKTQRAAKRRNGFAPSSLAGKLTLRITDVFEKLSLGGCKRILRSPFNVRFAITGKDEINKENE